MTGPRIARAVRGPLVLLLLLGGAVGLRAQPAAPAAMVHALRAGGGGLDSLPRSIGVLQRPAAPAYDVVALRVEFQPDTSRFTTGPGVFTDSLFRGIEVKIDPLPHDAAYFEAHLDFLADYVERVSDGRTLVRTHLVPEVVRLGQPMAAYSPTGLEADSDAELAKLAALVREAWTRASEQSDFDLAGFDPATTAFVLFHAGAGRDIELTGTSLDRTPQDLPSLFFDADALARLTPGPPIAFDGFPVESSLILPETESRLGRDFIADEDFVAEFSINGLLAASFFSYLGVPDLFDTETGTSAIGPFGLMDPLGIFALNGLFPPEPTAWTKQFLGWAEPVEADPSAAETFALDAAALLGSSDVVRVPISGAEYFLVENRRRAPEADELVLTIFRDGALHEQRIPLGADGFAGFDTEAFEGGVVVAADPYDWALPGGRDAGLGRRFDGGILIWHVDERVLRDGLASNRVNADPARRGVDLEEADGPQDLGATGDTGAESGTPFDYWFEGNPVAVVAEGDTLRLYQNRFGPGTVPSSDANDGGPSFVELAEFSAPGATMTFVARTALDAEVGIIPRTELWREIGFPFNREGGIVRLEDSQGGLIGFDSGSEGEDNGVFRLYDDATGEPITAAGGADTAPAVTGDGLIARLLALNGGGARLLLQSRDDVLTPGFFGPLADGAYAGPLIPVGEAFYAVAQTGSGSRVLRFERTQDAVTAVREGDVRTIAYSPDDGLIVVEEAEVWVENGGGWLLGGARPAGHAAFGRDEGGLVGAFVAEDGTLVWLLAGGTVRTVALPGDGAAPFPDPVLADLDHDGALDALTLVGSSLVAVGQGGAVVDGFPVALPARAETQPLVAELTDSGGWSVLVAALDGNIHAYDLGVGSRPVPGFPLPVGRTIRTAPLLAGETLYAVSGEGAARAWRIEGLGAVAWGSRFADQQNTSFARAGAPDPSPAAGLLNVDETYNWPNPIRDGRTLLRFETAEAAEVTITIVDLAGALVEELTRSASGGVPEEVEWRTDAPSGVYFARVKAVGASGREATHLIRMAVIR